jgi:hypothetical protein|tara:strand:+ start:234 stop:554 length:321 start_codon:yes stop_codon:yes gene_type:complete
MLDAQAAPEVQKNGRKDDLIFGTKKPMEFRHHGLGVAKFIYPEWSLTQGSCFRFFILPYYLSSCRIHREHGDCIVSTANHLAQITAFTARFNNRGLRGVFIQHDAV